MKHNLWDRMMYRLLQEKKEKEVKANKSKGSKPDFLDLDKDGDKEEPMSKASKEAGGKKDAPKAKKGKGKIPPQLKMHIQKKKKSKLDEEIERLEKILFEELTDVPLEEDDDFEGDEDFDDDDDDSCPYCGSEEGYDTYSGECEECGYEAHKSTPEEDIDDPEPGEGWGTEEEDLENQGDDYEDLGETIEYLSEVEVKAKKPRLGKVTRNPSGSKKKFHVYVKCGGRVKKISFGDPGLSIKRDSAARRKNFRARHKCDKPAGKDRCTARYWSCYQWRAGKKVEGEE